MSGNILIYSGPGAGPLSVSNTVTTIRSLVSSNYKVIEVGPDVILSDAWLDNTSLLVMPGGADRPYLAKLKGKGNDNIRKYVENGGNYLGICAGAYYSADYIEFAKGDAELEVTGKRELKFFPGLVSGPTYLGFEHRDLYQFKGTRAARLFWQLEEPFAKNKEFLIFYNGGGSFMHPEKYANVEVLARYQPEADQASDYPAAIVECKVGSGTAILSGPHFEWDPETLDTNCAQLCIIKPPLVIGNPDRLRLTSHLLNRLGIV